MRKTIKLTAALLVISLAGIASCESKQRGPIEVTAAQGKNAVKAVIGKEGGVIQFAQGGAKLEVPPGLLMEEVSVTLKRVSPVFDLSRKDFVGQAYRISPKMDFSPGTAKLHVPVDKPLPGVPADIDLRMYYYDRLESLGPEGPTFVHAWQVHKTARFTGYSQDQKYLLFDIHQTISDRTTKSPFGLFQAAFNMQ